MRRIQPSALLVGLTLFSFVLACGDDEPAVPPGPDAAAGRDAAATAGSGGAAGSDAGPTDASVVPDARGMDDDAGSTPMMADSGPALTCPTGEVPCDDNCVREAEPTLNDIHRLIIGRTCALAESCHLGVAAKEGFNLTSAETMFEFVGKASKQYPSLNLIEPGNPEDSYLIHKLRNMDIAAMSSTGVAATRMPPPPTRALCEERIRVIEAWIRAGAKR